jgi:p-cumate 2,3-dioxygenase beta subunit
MQRDHAGAHEIILPARAAGIVTPINPPHGAIVGKPRQFGYSRFVKTTIQRSDVEDFLYHEAALLDAWRLDEWLALLADDATYRVPSNDRPQSDPATTLFMIADDIRRIRARVTRLKDPHAHAESPRSRTRRLISNVRIVERDPLRVEANFIIHRFRGNDDVRQYVGHYRFTLIPHEGSFRIKTREAVLDSMELGALGTVSFIL